VAIYRNRLGVKIAVCAEKSARLASAERNAQLPALTAERDFGIRGLAEIFLGTPIQAANGLPDRPSSQEQAVKRC